MLKLIYLYIKSDFQGDGLLYKTERVDQKKVSASDASTRPSLTL